MNVFEMGALLQIIWMDTTYHHTYVYERQKMTDIYINIYVDR